MAYAYVAGAAADELTMRRNREAFDEILLRPRVLMDVSRVDTRVELLGQTLDFPFCLRPRLITASSTRRVNAPRLVPPARPAPLWL